MKVSAAGPVATDNAAQHNVCYVGYYGSDGHTVATARLTQIAIRFVSQIDIGSG